MADPNLVALNALCRLRRVETDISRRDLAEALTQETALVARDRALGRETDEARKLAGDFDRQAFAAWFGRVRDERIRLADALRAVESQTVTLRITLAHRRVAETAAEEALARALEARAATVARREQVILEDVSRTLKRLVE